MRKQHHKKQGKKRTEQLEPIQEFKRIEIYDIITNPNLKQISMIQKLEDLLPDNSSQILINFAIFYLRLVGLDKCIEDISGITLEKLKFEESINKLEKLQLQNELNLINGDALQSIENNQCLIEFYDTLFSTSTDLPFECQDFFLYHYNWLMAMSQTKFRTSRICTMELIKIIVKSLINYLQYNEQKEQKKEIVKFLNNIFEYLVSNRCKDIHYNIKKKSISLVFEAFLIDQIPKETYYKQLGLLFLSEHHECRQLAIEQLEQILKSQIEKKDSIQQIIEFINQQQEAVISLIFDNNESIQLKLIQLLKLIQKLEKINFFQEKTKNAFIRIMFIKNQRIKYECSYILDNFIQPLRTISDLVNFYIKYSPYEQILYIDCFNFIISFIQSKEFIIEPQSYSIFFQQDKSDQFQLIGLYFFASILQYQFEYQKFWWIEESEQMIEYNEHFTSYFINMKTCQLDLLDQVILIGYLQIYIYLNYKIIKQIEIKQILNSCQKLLQKQTEIELIDNICNLISVCVIQQENNEIIKDIKKYFIQQYKDKLNNLNAQKINCLIKYNIINWNSLIQPLTILYDLKGEQNSIRISEILSSSLQQTLRNMLKNNKNQSFDESLYKDIRDQFYNYSIQILENKQQQNNHYQILQIILLNIIYTNNFKFQKINFHYQLQSQHYQLIYISLYNYLFKDLRKQLKQYIDENNNNIDQGIKKKSITFEHLPQISNHQMEVLNLSVKVLNNCPFILINIEFGIQLLAQLLELMRYHPYFREQQTNFIAVISQSLNKIIENDLLNQNKDFFNFITDYSKINYYIQKEDDFNDFVKLCITSYLNSVNKQNINVKKELFINYCAELIYQGFSDINNQFIFGLLNHIFNKPTRLLKQLQIDKLTYQKFYAFYESKSAEFHESQRSEIEKKEILKAETSFRNKLKQQTGLSSKEIAKIVNRNQKSPQRQNSDNKNDAQLDEEIEEEIPFNKQMKK